MARYIEFPLEGGGTILVEAVDDSPKGLTGFAGRTAGDHGRENAESAHQSFDEAVENVRKSADLLVSKLRNLSSPPDEMQVNFNLKASAELGGLTVGKGTADAAYSIMLKWRRDEKAERKEPEKSEKKEETPGAIQPIIPAVAAMPSEPGEPTFTPDETPDEEEVEE